MAHFKDGVREKVILRFGLKANMSRLNQFYTAEDKRLFFDSLLHEVFNRRIHVARVVGSDNFLGKIGE